MKNQGIMFDQKEDDGFEEFLSRDFKEKSDLTDDHISEIRHSLAASKKREGILNFKKTSMKIMTNTVIDQAELKSLYFPKRKIKNKTSTI